MKTIILKGQEYNAKLDFKTLANIQKELKNNGTFVTMEGIFEAVGKQDFEVITEIVVQSILRCHKKLKREDIENKLDFDEIFNVFEFIADLIKDSMPKTKEDTEGN